MKKAILIITAICIAITASGQDIITTREGDEIQAKVTDILDSEIKYKKWSNPDGPTYTMNKGEVFMIKYQNGEKDIFKGKGSQVPTDNDVSNEASVLKLDHLMLNSNENANNTARIKLMNQPVEVIKSGSKQKKASYALCGLGIKENSVVSTDDLEIGIGIGAVTYANGSTAVQEFSPSNSGYCFLDPGMYFILTNKTGKTIYVDLGNTFFVCFGSPYCFYTPSSTTTSSSSSAGVGVNLGAVAGAVGMGGMVGGILNGVNVGGGSAHGVTNTIYSQRVVAVPPHSQYQLPVVGLFGKKEREIAPGIFVDRDDWNVAIGCYFITTNFNDRELLTGERVVFSEDQSPMNFSFIVAYSDKEDCVKEKVMSADIYLREILGTENRKDVEKKELGGFWAKVKSKKNKSSIRL